MEVKGKLLGPYHLHEDALITGMIVGDLIAEGGIHLDLRGMVTGILIVDVGSNIEVTEWLLARLSVKMPN